MSKNIDPRKYEQCNTKVGNIDSIAAVKVLTYHYHLKCSGLNKEESSTHIKNNNLKEEHYFM